MTGMYCIALIPLFMALFTGLQKFQQAVADGAVGLGARCAT